MKIRVPEGEIEVQHPLKVPLRGFRLQNLMGCREGDPAPESSATFGDFLATCDVAECRPASLVLGSWPWLPELGDPTSYVDVAFSSLFVAADVAVLDVSMISGD